MEQVIILGDCLEELKKLNDQTFDIVVTSPPYNINNKYNTYQDNLAWSDYFSWMDSIFLEIKRVLKNDGSFFLNVGSTCKEPFISFDIAQIGRKHFILQNNIVWIKSISLPDKTGEITSYGHYKPIAGRKVTKRFVNLQHESIFHFTKNGFVELDRLAIGVPYIDKFNIERWKNKDKEKQDKRCRGNVWFIPYKTSNEKVKTKYNHPAGFPEQLPESCIKLHGVKSDTMVLDPFLGAGTTLVVCKKLGIQGTGIELDEKYVQIAKTRCLSTY